jgi:steroid delta-isomerase
MRRLAVLMLLLCWVPAVAGTEAPDAEIRAALVQWTADFNAGHADAVCDIFAPSLRADVAGAAERDFDAQCALLRKTLGDSSRSFSYALDLKEILAEGDMAAVRLKWTLTARVKATGTVSTTEEQGLDVFGKGSDGRWRIIRFMSWQRP